MNRPKFHIHIGESIKSTPVAMYFTPHTLYISLRVSIISSSCRCRNHAFLLLSWRVLSLV